MFKIAGGGAQTVFVLTMPTIGHTHQLELLAFTSAVPIQAVLGIMWWAKLIYYYYYSIWGGGGGGVMRRHHYDMLCEFLLHTCCLIITMGGPVLPLPIVLVWVVTSLHAFQTTAPSPPCFLVHLCRVARNAAQGWI